MLAFGFGGYHLGIYLYDNETTKQSFEDLRKAISNAKRENKQQDAKFDQDEFKVGDKADKAEKKGNMDKFLGQELLKRVAAKKQEILSKTAVAALESQPKLKGIEDILRDGIKNHISETNASLLQA